MTHYILSPESTGEIPGGEGGTRATDAVTERLTFPDKTLHLAPFDPAAPPVTNASAETAIVRLPATALDTDIDVPLDFDPGPYPPVPMPVPPQPDDIAQTEDVTLLQALGAQRHLLPIVPVKRWGGPEGIYPPVRVADDDAPRMRGPGDPGRRRAAGAPRWAVAAIGFGLVLLGVSVGAAFALAWAVTW